jgi:hypothetical protein
VLAIAVSSQTARYGVTAAARTLTPSPWDSPARALGDPRARGRSSTLDAFAADFTLPRPRLSAARLSPSPRSARTPVQLRPHLPGAEHGARAFSGQITVWTLPMPLPPTPLDSRAMPSVRNALPPGSVRCDRGFVSERVPELSGGVSLASPRPQVALLPPVIGHAQRMNAIYTMISMPTITNATSVAYPTVVHLAADASLTAPPSLATNMAVLATSLYVTMGMERRVSRPLDWWSAQ